MKRKVRRKKTSAAARLRPFWFIAALLAIVVGAGLYYAATWPGFYPRRVRISGNRVVSTQAIAAAARIAPDANLWLQNMGAARERILRIPYVKDVWTHRTLPANLAIVVSERVPYAVVQFAHVPAIVDSDLRILQDGSDAALPVFEINAPVVPPPGSFLKDEDAHRLDGDYRTLLAAHVVVHSVAYDKYGDLVAVMPGGVRLLLGDDADLAQSSRLVEPILSQVAQSGRRIAALDLRAVKTPVVVYKTGVPR